MKWYENITEAAWFKRLDNPKTRLGHALITVTALAFGVVAFAQNPNLSHDCSSNPLRAVYNPHRLVVVKTCDQVTGAVKHVSKERDGDLHIQMAVDPAYNGWLTPKNYTRQSGFLVVEYMPSDPYPRPTVGERLRLNCTHVLDHQHGGWAECHPVWSVQPLGAAAGKVEP